MPDILSPAITVTKQIKTRAPSITISNPASPAEAPFAGKVIDFNCSHVLSLNGEVVAAVTTDNDGKGLPPNVQRKVDEVYTETVTVTDPVTGQSVTLSVAGLALTIETLFARWFAEDAAPQ